MHDDVRAVGVGQREVEGVVLTSFFSLSDSPKQAAKRPLAETPFRLSGVKVADSFRRCP